MFRYTFQIFFSLVLCTGTVICQWKWDFAVTTNEKIIFYDDKWTEVKSAAHQFNDMSAIAYDESQDRIFFHDQHINDNNIHTLKLGLSKTYLPLIDDVVARLPNESVVAMAYDPLNRNLYWTDVWNKKIYFLTIDGKENPQPKVLFDFTDDDTVPNGIAVDVCRRNLYWTNSNGRKPSIEMSSLSGKERKKLIVTDLYSPHGIVVDQLTDRIFYVVNQEGVHFTIESSKLDGTDRQIIVRDINGVPFSLTVTSDFLYWTDISRKSVYMVPKDNITNGVPVKVKSFPNNVRGIVSRLGMNLKLKNDEDCRNVMQKISTQLQSKPSPTKSARRKDENNDMICLSNGIYSEENKVCSCNAGYGGTRCETYQCHNFCVHGSCEIVEDSPKCTCKHGFTGEHCQTSICNNYCMNDGRCRIVDDDKPVCDCDDGFIGNRCENNATEICTPFCMLLQMEIEVDLPFNCYYTCKYSDVSPRTCNNNSWNKSIIVIVSGVLGSLILIYLIIQAIRRIYKPARPRIKKTFVVQKKMSQTPLTSRPIATEQCEITIENCCNMNICDTPCFDPKLLQQNIQNQSRKEDKQILIAELDNEIY